MPGVVRYTLRRNSSIRPRESNRQLWVARFRINHVVGLDSANRQASADHDAPSVAGEVSVWLATFDAHWQSIDRSAPLARFGLQNAFRFINKSIRRCNPFL